MICSIWQHSTTNVYHISHCRISWMYIYATFIFFSIRFLLPFPFKSMLLVSVKMSTISEIKTLIKAITTLLNSLPQSVQQGMKEDKIWSVMNMEEYEMALIRCYIWGRLLRCFWPFAIGRFGLSHVYFYLSKIDWADNFPLNIVEIKLQRLLTELKHLYIFIHFQPFCLMADIHLSGSDADPTVQTWPSCHTAPTSKLTNANNTTQPELSFQHKAVQAFHTQWAQETTSVTNGDAPADTIGSVPISTPKRDINMTININVGKPGDSVTWCHTYWALWCQPYTQPQSMGLRLRFAFEVCACKHISQLVRLPATSHPIARHLCCKFTHKPRQHGQFFYR